MEFFPFPVTMMMCSIPETTHSSTTYWICGLSTTVSISLGCALVAGKNRVPSPAAGSTALRTRRGVVVGETEFDDDVVAFGVIGPVISQLQPCLAAGITRAHARSSWNEN